MAATCGTCFSMSAVVSSLAFWNRTEFPIYPQNTMPGSTAGSAFLPASIILLSRPGRWLRSQKRDELRAKGVETTEIVDHGWARSIYFKDPNGISLEYCCMVGKRPDGDELMQGQFTLPRAALELNDTLTKGRSAGNRAKMEV